MIGLFWGSFIIIIVKIHLEQSTICYMIVLMSVLDVKAQNNDNYYIMNNLICIIYVHV